jgi:5'-phosphate synthase pdxT subunit
VTEYGVLALQGDWAAHRAILRDLGAPTRPVRTAADLAQVDALVIPGGESSAMLRLMEPENLARKIRDRITAGMAILATCAGVILLAEHIQPPQESLGVLGVEVIRNAYGRQPHSTVGEIALTQELGEPFQMEGVFIRAPRIVGVNSEVAVLGRYRDDPVLVRQERILGATFHPELTADRRIHKMFIALARSSHRVLGEVGHG